MPFQSRSKRIPHKKFFKIPSLEQLSQLESLQHILESDCFEDGHPGINKTIILTSSYLVLCEPQTHTIGSKLVKFLDNEVKFKRIFKTSEKQGKTSLIDGFQLITKSGEKTSFHFEVSSIAQIWVSFLSKILIETDFQIQYQLLGKIGSGSSASVYSVRRYKDNKYFAAKIFSKQELQQPKKKENFFYEIELLRGLQHPNIMKTVGVLESQNSYFVISELLTGGNLLQRINTQRGFSLQNTKKILRGVLQGLAYLHKFRVIHRDIKLENIMLKSLDSWEPIIVDFGLAVFSDEEQYINYKCGTPGYIAPQILNMKGKSQLNVACDIFSAGAMFHIMLTNHYLFPGNTSNQIFEMNKTFSFNLGHQKYKKVGIEGMNLLKAMLNLAWSDRISAKECLNHQFLRAEFTQDDLNSFQQAQ